MDINEFANLLLGSIDPDRLDTKMAGWSMALYEQSTLYEVKNDWFNKRLAEAEDTLAEANEHLISVDDSYDEVEHIAARLDDPMDPKWLTLCRKRYDDLDEMRIKFLFVQEMLTETKQKLLHQRDEILQPLERDIVKLFNLAVSVGLTYQYLAERR